MHGQVQVSFPPLLDIVAVQFKGMAKNLAYITSFAEQSSALSPRSNGFTVDLQSGGISVAYDWQSSHHPA